MTAALAVAPLAAAPLAANPSSGGSVFSGILPLLLIVVAFYFFVIRPGRNRQRQAQQLQSALQPGQEVMTGSGAYGRVVEIADDSVLLEMAPGVRVRWARGAVSRVLNATGSDVYDASGTPAAEDSTVDLTTHDSTDYPDDPERRPGH